MAVNLNSYPHLLASRFEFIMRDAQPEKMERAWILVAEQQNRKDVIDAATIFYKYFPKNPKKVTLKFSDGSQEFGASQIECFKKESQTLEKMLSEGYQIALKIDEFCGAINSLTAPLEVAYYLNIPRLITGAEQDLLKRINHWKNTGNYEDALAFLKRVNASHLKNTPFCKHLVEDDLADLFGSVLLLYANNSVNFSKILNAYIASRITAISLSFETEAARSVAKHVGSIDSLRTFKVNSFSVKDNELSFPKHVTHVELKNTSEITVETLKAIPISVVSMTLIGVRFTKEDFKFLPSSLNRLIIRESYQGLAPTPLPDSLTYLELEKCFDLNDEWFKSLPNLQTLIIRHCSKVTGKSLLNIPKTVTYLEMIGSRINDDDLINLPENLQTLIIPETSVTDAAPFPNHLLKLDVSGTGITDVGIGKLDKLTYLAANRTSIKGSTLNTLQSLTHLYLEGCPIEKQHLATIHRSVTHLSLSTELKDEDVVSLPNKLNALLINGASLTESGLLLLARSLTDVHIIGSKMHLEGAKCHLPDGCAIRI